MSNIDIKEPNLQENFEEYVDEDEEDYDSSIEGALQEVRDELTTHSELLEQLVSICQEKAEEDKLFQDKLINVLEKIANK